MKHEQIMNPRDFIFHGETLTALASGALYWRAQGLLVVSDLHFGKSARVARWGGAQLPPYETSETLDRLERDLSAVSPARVICLGDSFDAPGLDTALPEADLMRLATLQAGLDWTWIEGNHDPGPVSLGGSHRAAARIGPLVFRHIASEGGSGEVSGHYHPKAVVHARGRSISRPCFLVDADRLILPAYGAFAGGLRCDSPALARLMGSGAQAILTGPTPARIPAPGRRPLP